ncbi:DNA internalization-related competence protein ComEC/Rec2 [Psychrobacillus sp. FSL K6-2836]|uniref:DNA internalization-related competence protein ComEC/Rec2 n=1 Tax=Psychrobacillus sp. FSL K6-2836 TaxID=2921548 RepID=UPI0030F7C231
MILLWLVYKQFSILYISISLSLGIGCYFYTEQRIPVPPLEQNVTQITWTDIYRINGSTLRGFATSEKKDKWYVQLKLESEQHKEAFTEHSLAGLTMNILTEEVSNRPKAHMYAFDMDNYLKSNGSVGQLQISQYELIGKKNDFLTFMAGQRFKMKQHIQDSFPLSLQAEAEALLIGSREQMPTDMQSAYQTLGITHLFAISGLHVALIAWLFYEKMIHLGVRRETANLLLLICLPLYALLAGGAPSVWRSVSVTEIVLISMYFQRKIAVEDAFSLSIIGFIFLTPWIIFQIGFQLSYLAAFSLIYSSILLKSSQSYLFQSFIITAVCQIIVYPILLYHFYEISVSSFLANLIFVPLFSFVILPLNLFFLLLTFILPSLGENLFLIYEPLRNLLDILILKLGAIPYQLWNPMKPQSWMVFLAYISVVLILTSLERKKNVFLSTLFFLFVIVIIQLAPYMDSSTRITFVNVGQGDCILIEMPFRKQVIMIDTGGLLRFDQEIWKQTDEPYEIGRQVVLPLLKGKGIHTIDTLILTHADADHMEGAEEVVRGVKVKEIHITPGSAEKEVMRDLWQEIEKQRIPIYEKRAGDKILSNYFHLQYLYPMDETYEGNNDSLVLSMRNDHFHGLFIGDLEEQGELDLVEHYSLALKQIDVLKVGHHGSKTSSNEQFLALVQPDVAIIQAGFENRYGHPHPEVVERLKELQIPYLQTGTDGTIEVEINKSGGISITIP